MECLPLRHGDDLQAALRPGDSLINFAIDPVYRSGLYHEDQDCDLRAARAAAAAGCHFTMLSTRRVYGAQSRWDAAETASATGDETAYGRNKATSERAARQICGDAIGIFRLSNIFGYEYAQTPRRTFLGLLLHALKQQDKIYFDMAPATRRDFLPVEICAKLLVARSADRTAGTYNLGSGFAVPCGDMAGWVMEGYGGGELVCNSMDITDEFFLNMGRWRSQYDLPVDTGLLKAYCVGLGRRLECERS